MKDVIFENPRNKKLSKPIDEFKKLPEETLNKLSKIEKKEVIVKDED